jgi:hypothetical protein
MLTSRRHSYLICCPLLNGQHYNEVMPAQLELVG